MHPETRSGCAETLAGIAEVNEECLEFWCDSRLIGVQLDAPARRRAAACPFLFVDLRAGGSLNGPNSSDGRGNTIALHILTLAWYIARCRPADGRMMLGLSSEDMDIIAGYTPARITGLAEKGRVRVTPRWPDRHDFWHELYRHSIAENRPALETTRLRGLQLMVAEHLSDLRCA